MGKQIGLVLTAILFLGADDAKKEYERFEGAWKMIAMEAEGMKVPEETFKNTKLILKGDKFTFTDGSATYKGTYKVDVSKKPKTIDITFEEGPEKRNTVWGIYELEGDVYKVCLVEGNKKRPTEFTAKPGTGQILEILHREK
jgi:uncharacterized protein (TIGR03067 family)